MSNCIQFDDWIGGDPQFPSRAWTAWGELEIYVRIAKHLCRGDLFDCLDIANVGITEESKRGQGKFTEFIRHVEEIAKERGLAVYAESISNDRLLGFLLRRGYQNIDIEFPSPISSVFLPPNASVWETPHE